MKELLRLYEKIIQRVKINLRELDIDVSSHVEGSVHPEQMSKFYAFYGITTDHPLNLVFKHSGLAGSYFLGKCRVENSLLYKSDIRGDELKRAGTSVTFNEFEITLDRDEVIDIRDSLFVKTLVHNYSHDPETPEVFFIKDVLSMDFANIHGSPTDGALLGPFATVDLTTIHDCVIGAYSYIQAGEIGHLHIAPGTIWVNSPGKFNFYYRYDPEILSKYVTFGEGGDSGGLLFDFIEKRQDAFQRVFDAVNLEAVDFVPRTASLDRYAVVLPKTSIADNVLVSQRAYLENSTLGKGANAQENCFIVNSTLEGCNVTAHGAKLVEADLEEFVFVGFNSFLSGKPGCRIKIGRGCVIMPHTIIDVDEPLSIPPEHLVWGFVGDSGDLETNSISLAELAEKSSCLTRGRMHFEGDGGLFVQAFKDRIHHILEVNGAFFDGDKASMGHAQRNQNLSLNTIQPFQFGEMTGMYPDIIIRL